MSNQATFWVWEFSESTGLNRLVLLTLAHRHNLEKKGCWPSYKTIARDCRVSEATARRSVQALVDLHEVHRTVRKDEAGDSTSNFYSLPLFEIWYGGIHKQGVRANGPHPVRPNRPHGGIPQSTELRSESGSIEQEAATPRLSNGAKKVGRVILSAGDVEAYNKLYQEHPELRPEDW